MRSWELFKMLLLFKNGGSNKDFTCAKSKNYNFSSRSVSLQPNPLWSGYPWQMAEVCKCEFWPFFIFIIKAGWIEALQNEIFPMILKRGPLSLKYQLLSSHTGYLGAEIDSFRKVFVWRLDQHSSSRDLSILLISFTIWLVLSTESLKKTMKD